MPRTRYKSPAECQTLDDIPAWLRNSFESGEAPCDEPPGLTECYYQKWLKLGGKIVPPKPVTVDDL